MSAGAETRALHLSDRKMARESECGGVWREACKSTAEGDGSHRQLLGGACVHMHAQVLFHCTELKARRRVSGLDLVTHWPCDLQ